MAKSKRKRPPRRPTVRGNTVYARYSPELGREICRRIARGELWTQMAGRGGMPSCGALYDWRRKHPAFAEALAQAREIAAEGGHDLPSNLHILEGDMMKDELLTPEARRLPGKTPRRNGGVDYVRYSDRTVRAICDGLRAGRLWREMVNERGMPSHSTFFAWRVKYPEFAHAVREARAMAAEDRFEEAYETSRDAAMETLAKDKLHVETCMSQAGRLDPWQFTERGRMAAQAAAAGSGHIQTFVIRHFEKVTRDDGTSELIAIDSLQQVER